MVLLAVQEVGECVNSVVYRTRNMRLRGMASRLLHLRDPGQNDVNTSSIAHGEGVAAQLQGCGTLVHLLDQAARAAHQNSLPSAMKTAQTWQ